MKSSRHLIVAVLILLAPVSATVSGQLDVTTFRGPNGSSTAYGAWAYDGNWDNHVPDATKQAVIPSNRKVAISWGYCTTVGWEGLNVTNDTCGSDPPVCDSCTQGPPDRLGVAGSISVGAGSYLDIDAFDVGYALKLVPAVPSIPSRVDGVMLVYPGAKILLAGDITVQGVGGGTLDGSPRATLGPAIIEAAPGVLNPTLTLVGDPYPSDLVLRGAWRINVPVTNNATVRADRRIAGEGITLLEPINGNDGLWIAEQLPNKAPGVLSIQDTASGSATWMITTAASIIFNAPPELLSGDFVLSAGLLDIRQNFATSGDLRMTGGTITLAKYKKADFSK